MRTTVLCQCVDSANRPNRNCDLGCNGTGVICGLCGSRGRLSNDFPCPSCEAGRDYYASMPPTAEQMRLARELAVLLA